MPFTLLDVILVAIMLLSGFLAMLRGLTREMLAIMSWAMAALATLFLFPLYIDTVKHYITPESVAKAVLAGGVFLLVLGVSSLITIKLSDQILDSRVGAIDRTLGLVFGLARGFLLVVIAFRLVALIVGPEGVPGFMREAYSANSVDGAGRAIESLLPDNVMSMFRSSRETGAADETGGEGRPPKRR